LLGIDAVPALRNGPVFKPDQRAKFTEHQRVDLLLVERRHIVAVFVRVAKDHFAVLVLRRHQVLRATTKKIPI